MDFELQMNPLYFDEAHLISLATATCLYKEKHEDWSWEDCANDALWADIDELYPDCIEFVNDGSWNDLIIIIADMAENYIDHKHTILALPFNFIYDSIIDKMAHETRLAHESNPSLSWYACANEVLRETLHFRNVTYKIDCTSQDMDKFCRNLEEIARYFDRILKEEEEEEE